MCIAVGLVQMMMFSSDNVKSIQAMRYTRSKAEGVISEATMMQYLRCKLLIGFDVRPGSYVNEFIRRYKMKNSGTKEAA